MKNYFLIAEVPDFTQLSWNINPSGFPFSAEFSDPGKHFSATSPECPEALPKQPPPKMSKNFPKNWAKTSKVPLKNWAKILKAPLKYWAEILKIPLGFTLKTLLSI